MISRSNEKKRVQTMIARVVQGCFSFTASIVTALIHHDYFICRNALAA